MLPLNNDVLENDASNIAHGQGRAKLVGVEFAGAAFQNHG